METLEEIKEYLNSLKLDFLQWPLNGQPPSDMFIFDHCAILIKDKKEEKDVR
jgi:hypothetical protein